MTVKRTGRFQEPYQALCRFPDAGRSVPAGVVESAFFMVFLAGFLLVRKAAANQNG